MMNNQGIQKAINHFTMLRRLDSGEKKGLYDIAISALEQQLNDGWISVTERLPKNNKHESGEPIEFNVTLRYGAVATTGCINNDGVWGWMDWCKLKFNPFGVDVLYWQPLPKILAEVSE